MAKVRLPALFSDGMVLQRDMPVAVWGWGGLSEQVTVRIGSQTISTATDENGKWMVRLAPMPVSDKPAEIWPIGLIR